MFTSNRGLHPPLQHVHEGEVWMHPLLLHQLWFEHALQGRRMKMERRRHKTRLSLEVVQTLPISTVNRKLKTKSLANIISQFQQTPRSQKLSLQNKRSCFLRDRRHETILLFLRWGRFRGFGSRGEAKKLRNDNERDSDTWQIAQNWNFVTPMIGTL
jgi:hypothetical protein